LRVPAWTASTSASRAPATIPSAQKWFAVTITASVVIAGYSTASQRHGERSVPMMATATSSAQPTWTEGMADS
jgi:hypothetical protein